MTKINFFIGTVKRNNCKSMVKKTHRCRKSSVWKIVISEHRKCTKWPQNGVETWKAKGTSYILYMLIVFTYCPRGTSYMLIVFTYCPQGLNFTPFHMTIARFPDNWGFRFPHMLQRAMWNFRKQNRLKLENIKNPKHHFVRTIRRKIQDKFESVGCDL